MDRERDWVSLGWAGRNNFLRKGQFKWTFSGVISADGDLQVSQMEAAHWVRLYLEEGNHVEAVAENFRKGEHSCKDKLVEMNMLYIADNTEHRNQKLK